MRNPSFDLTYVVEAINDFRTQRAPFHFIESALKEQYPEFSIVFCNPFQPDGFVKVCCTYDALVPTGKPILDRDITARDIAQSMTEIRRNQRVDRYDHTTLDVLLQQQVKDLHTALKMYLHTPFEPQASEYTTLKLHAYHLARCCANITEKRSGVKGWIDQPRFKRHPSGHARRIDTLTEIINQCGSNLLNLVKGETSDRYINSRLTSQAISLHIDDFFDAGGLLKVFHALEKEE